MNHPIITSILACIIISSTTADAMLQKNSNKAFAKKNITKLFLTEKESTQRIFKRNIGNAEIDCRQMYFFKKPWLSSNTSTEELSTGANFIKTNAGFVYCKSNRQEKRELLENMQHFAMVAQEASESEHTRKIISNVLFATAATIVPAWFICFDPCTSGCSFDCGWLALVQAPAAIGGIVMRYNFSRREEALKDIVRTEKKLREFAAGNKAYADDGVYWTDDQNEKSSDSPESNSLRLQKKNENEKLLIARTEKFDDSAAAYKVTNKSNSAHRDRF